MRRLGRVACGSLGARVDAHHKRASSATASRLHYLLARGHLHLARQERAACVLPALDGQDWRDTEEGQLRPHAHRGGDREEAVSAAQTMVCPKAGEFALGAVGEPVAAALETHIT